MSWLTDIFSGGTSGIAAGAVQGALSGVGTLAKDLRAAITGTAVIDSTKLAEIQEKAMELDYATQKAQTDINAIEAANPKLFIAGWRPFIGWICGLALGWQFIGSPMFEWVVKVCGKTVVAPTIDTGGLITILMALLGLGTMRTVEKTQGSVGNH